MNEKNEIEITNMSNQKYRTHGFKCGMEAFNFLSPIPEKSEIDLGNGRILRIVDWNPKGTPESDAESEKDFGHLEIELTGIISLKKADKNE